MSVSITQQQLFAVLQPFIATVTGLSQSLVIQALANRSAMPPASPGFAVMTMTVDGRLRTNLDTWDKTSLSPTEISSEQGTKVRLQVDIYGSTAFDMAIQLSTLWRDQYGCDQLSPTCVPLYTDDPILAPLDDSEMQYEQRYTVACYLQYNPVVTTPMQFADSADITLIAADVEYPP